MRAGRVSDAGNARCVQTPVQISRTSQDGDATGVDDTVADDRHGDGRALAGVDVLVDLLRVEVEVVL
jgi:hypothetical protein